MEAPLRRNINTPQYWERVWSMTGEHKGSLPAYQFALFIAPKGAKFVDLGCGTGTGMRYLISNGLQGIGVDYASNCAEYVKENHPKMFDIRIQDMQDPLPFKDEEFFLVMAVMSFYCLDRPTEMLREAWRILEPGGNLLIVNPHAHTWKEEFYFTPTMRELHSYIKPVFPECLVFKYQVWKMALATKVVQ